MLFYSHKYLSRFIQKTISSLILLMVISMAGYSQITPLQKDSLAALTVKPVRVSLSQKPVQTMTMHINPPYKPFVLRKGGELMHWPNYPLTAGQIIAREAEWQRRNNQSFGERVASDVIKNSVNSLIYGRKAGPATVPKF